MERTIENEYVTAVVSEQAGELISFKRKDNGIETIWCRDPKYWYNCNPLLFPYTRQLVDGRYTLKGKTIELGQHGFARRAHFSFDKVAKDEASVVLSWDEETMKVYPYKFRITQNYKLEGYKVIITVTVENLDEEDLPFNLGFHPAFNCPLTPDKTYDDYRIEFELEEDLHHPEKNMTVGKSFTLKDNLVDGSFFYDNDSIRSRWCQLTDGVHTVRVGKEGYYTVGFWHKTPDTPFMCIEPWFPHNELKKACTFRPDTENNLLPPGEKFSCQYYFEIIA